MEDKFSLLTDDELYWLKEMLCVAANSTKWEAVAQDLRSLVIKEFDLRQKAKNV